LEARDDGAGDEEEEEDEEDELEDVDDAGDGSLRLSAFPPAPLPFGIVRARARGGAQGGKNE
jgi:hypothetical protein